MVRQIGSLVKGLAPDGALRNVVALERALRGYADLIEPWARSVAGYMIADVARRDEAMWRKNSKEMGERLRREILYAPTGQILTALQAEQVELIQSIPREAANRVHELSLESLLQSGRAEGVAKQILATESVTASRARLIARTEVSRVSSNLLQARSEYAGSEGYIWRTSGDFDVRESHAEMEGKYVRWRTPPILDNLKGHAGCLPNCRCFAEPVLPDL